MEATINLLLDFPREHGYLEIMSVSEAHNNALLHVPTSEQTPMVGVVSVRLNLVGVNKVLNNLF